MSQLERDLTSPSIDSLSDILEALRHDLAEFFQEDKNDQFIFHADDFFVDEREDCTVNWIVPNTQKNQMEPILLELPEGGESFTVEPHDGEEFGYVVEGSVVLVCDGEEHPLAPRRDLLPPRTQLPSAQKRAQDHCARAVGLDPSPVLTSIDIRKGYWNHA